MKVEIKITDKIMAKRILQSIRMLEEMQADLLEKDELEPWEKVDFADNAMFLRDLRGAYRYFTPTSEWDKIDG